MIELHSVSVFKFKLNVFLDHKLYLFRGELTDISTKEEALELYLGIDAFGGPPLQGGWKFTRVCIHSDNAGGTSFY